MKKFINWETIRSIAELQILTRASYIAIIVIPIIAGLWPTVRVAINQYNKIVVESNIILNNTQKNLTNNISRLDSLVLKLNDNNDSLNIILNKYTEKLKKDTKTLNSHVLKFIENFNPEQLDTPKLPIVWVYAFFSSILVILAHSIYQSSSPEIIKKYNRIEYKENEREKFISSDSRTSQIALNATNSDRTYTQMSLSGSFVAKIAISLLYMIALFCIAIVIYLQSIAVLSAS